jgi:hypothetical protein
MSQTVGFDWMAQIDCIHTSSCLYKYSRDETYHSVVFCVSYFVLYFSLFRASSSQRNYFVAHSSGCIVSICCTFESACRWCMDVLHPLTISLRPSDLILLCCFPIHSHQIKQRSNTLSYTSPRCTRTNPTMSSRNDHNSFSVSTQYIMLNIFTCFEHILSYYSINE